MDAGKRIGDSYPELFPKDFGERLEWLRGAHRCVVGGIRRATQRRG